MSEMPPLNWIKRRLVQAERWVGRTMLTPPYEKGTRGMLFILGHMRTGSSLLAHILSSHRDIIGYGETHKTYDDTEDFGEVTADICRRLRAFPLGTPYVLDKVLHKRLIPRAAVLDHSAVRIIFIIRRPDMALSSMIRSGAVEESEKAFQHYVQQVKWVRQLSQRMSATQWTYTTYAELTQDTSVVFDRVERFLGLSEPLSENYETTHLTGVRGVGDSGPHIKSQRIKRDIEREVVPEVRMYVQPAQEHFERCRETLHRLNQY